MAQVVADSVKNGLLLLVDGNYLSPGLGGSTGCSGSGMSNADDYHIGLQGFCNLILGNGGRGNSPGGFHIGHRITS